MTNISKAENKTFWKTKPDKKKEVIWSRIHGSQRVWRSPAYQPGGHHQCPPLIVAATIEIIMKYKCDYHHPRFMMIVVTVILPIIKSGLEVTVSRCVRTSLRAHCAFAITHFSCSDAFLTHMMVNQPDVTGRMYQRNRIVCSWFLNAFVPEFPPLGLPGWVGLVVCWVRHQTLCRI